MLVGITVSSGGNVWQNGSYFSSNYTQYTPVRCMYNETLDGGGWVLPGGDDCNNATSPIQCNSSFADGHSIIALASIGNFLVEHELVYKCCQPHSCDDENTNIITINIFGKLLALKID